MRRALPVPHMGWNTARACSRPDPLLDGIDDCADLCLLRTQLCGRPSVRSRSATTEYGSTLQRSRATQIISAACNSIRSARRRWARACLLNFLRSVRPMQLDTRHRSARRPLRAAAPGRLRRRDALCGRPDGLAATLPVARRGAGCTSWTWTARKDGVRGNRAAIIAGWPASNASAFAGRRRSARSRQSIETCSTQAVARVVSAAPPSTHPQDVIELVHAVRSRAASSSPSMSASTIDRRARGLHTHGWRSAVERSALWDAVAQFASQRSAARVVHRREPRRRAVRARIWTLYAEAVTPLPADSRGRPRAAFATARDLQALAELGVAGGDQRQGAARGAHAVRGAASHSCQTHNPLSGRARRSGRQGRSLPRPPRRRRHP